MLNLLLDKRHKKLRVRIPIPSEGRLAVTLRHLAKGDSQKFIGFLFQLGRSTVNEAVDEVSGELWRAPADYVKPSTSIDDWKKIASDFHELWDISYCIGALDGKHTGILKSAFPGSL